MMTDDKRRMTLKTFDYSIRILFWSLDDFLILAPLCFLGVIFKSLYLIGLAFLLKSVYSHLKKKCGHQTISHYVYAYFPTSVCQKVGYFEGLPPSYLKEILLA
jgi:type IV conjugative transfer system protein TraL